jgi:fructoselysine-6-P-deglycase FrlB-like protein
MEGARELVESMQLAREMDKGHAEKFEITREEREQLAREAQMELAREMDEERAAGGSGLDIEMIDLLQASQMSELSDGDEKILEKLQRMRNKRGVKDLDDDPWSEEEEELVNRMEYARQNR